MSISGISALERGHRRTPQFETLALLSGALALTEEQRRELVAVAQFETVAGGASITVGPWPSLGPAKLPLALTQFVGRKAELDEIASLVGEHRFVTITGAGGVGKTQTALRAATALSDAEGTVGFVGLAAIGDASLVTTAIANALGVQEVPHHPLLETLVAFLKNKTALLVLDNCEHVVAEAATVADSLLRGCPNLRILATSREPLLAAGERTYRLPSLDDSEAVALFAHRAQAADAHFTLTDERQPIVGEICRYLSGIPLAIELAAARVTVLPVRALAKALNDRFQVFVGGDRTAPPRQRTMNATIDWSYELLDAPEQRLFERLSVFAGGCTIEAAMTVCEGGDLTADDVLPLISSLVGKSLVVADLEGYEPRYRLLEPFREYAREKLKSRGEEAAVARRHVRAYLELAEYHATKCGDQHSTIHYERSGIEIANWRAAVQWALNERNDVLAGQRLVAELVCSWGGGAVLNDGRRWVPACFDRIDEETPPDVIAKLSHAEAAIAMHLHTHDKLQLAGAQKAIAYYRELGDELRLVRAIDIVGLAFNVLSRNTEARAILEEGLQIARKLGYPRYIAQILRSLVYVGMDEGDFVAARECLTEALQLIEAVDDQIQLEGAITEHAQLTFLSGNPESAVRELTDFLAKGRCFYSPRSMTVYTQIHLSEYLIVLGRYEEAQEYAREAVETAREQHLDMYFAKSLGRLATIAVLRPAGCESHVHATAAKVLGFTDALFTALGVETERYAQHERVCATLCDALGASAVTSLMADGATMTEDEAVAAATAL